MKYDIYKTPQQDFLFQKIFADRRNRDMLTELIEEILGIKIKEIEVIRQAAVDKEKEENKEAILDLQVKADDERIIDIEMQIRNEHNIKKRSLYYGAALLHNEMEAGLDYNELKKVIVICILSFELFEEGNYIRKASIRDDDTYEEMIEDLRFYYIQIPKFLKQKDKKNKKLAQWLYFISQKDKKELKKAMVDNEKVARAQKQLDELLADKETMEEIRKRRMAEMDRNSIISIAEGRGREAGRKEGKAEGKEEGRKEGKKEEKIEIAKKMLAKNKPIEEIIEFTDLTQEEIKKLQKNKEKDNGK